jgi:hypothetical protein
MATTEQFLPDYSDLSPEGDPSELEIAEAMSDILEEQEAAGHVMGEALAGDWLRLNRQLIDMQTERLSK